MTLQKPVDDVVSKNNGASSSGGRRPPGRPRGSKNKPKLPVLVTRQESLDAHKVLVFEIPSGIDVGKCLSDYSRRRGRGLSILSCKGTVERVTLRQPSGCLLALQGQYEILALSGTLLPHPAAPRIEGLSLYVAGGQGQVIGGIVVAPLVASGPIVMSVFSFASAQLERLPLEEGGPNGITLVFNVVAGSATNQDRRS